MNENLVEKQGNLQSENIEPFNLREFELILQSYAMLLNVQQ